MRIGASEGRQPDEFERIVHAAFVDAPSTPRASSPVATFFQTVVQGKSVGSWKTRMREGSGPSMASPSAVIAPRVG